MRILRIFESEPPSSLRDQQVAMLVVSPSRDYEEKRLCVMWKSRAATFVFIVAMCRSDHIALLSFRGWSKFESPVRRIFC
jgi:uncharacterized DUF497 family protein